MKILETLKENKKKTIGIGVGVLTLLGGIALANKLGDDETIEIEEGDGYFSVSEVDAEETTDSEETTD